MRRKQHSAHRNHERWLVSYADFITLLFAFFVVMFATSQADKGKAEQVSESVKKALEGERMSTVVASILGGTVQNKGQGNAMMRGPGGVIRQPASKDDKKKETAELITSFRVLSAALQKDIEAGRIQVSMESRGLVISFRQAALFPSGEDLIAPEAEANIRTVADAMNKIPNPVRLEGHTDSMPIHTARFHSNWELSAARSIALLELLADRYGVDRARLSIGGYAETAPLESNDTEEGRARNRRVDIVILNETGALAEPGKNVEPRKNLEPEKGVEPQKTIESRKSAHVQ